MSNTFAINIDSFSGPLDLLLKLIEKRKLHISDISLAQVTDDYLYFLNQSSTNIPKKDIADFLVIASTLMVIKSSTLLPDTNPIENTEDALQAEELANRLKAYNLLKDVSRSLAPLFAIKKMWFKKYKPLKLTHFSPTPDVTKSNLQASAMNLIQTLPEIKNLPEVTVKKILSLEEVMANLSQKLQNSLSYSFSGTTKINQAEKIDIIMNFLGLLELLKTGLFEASQNDEFTDIQIAKANQN